MTDTIIVTYTIKKITCLHVFLLNLSVVVCIQKEKKKRHTCDDDKKNYKSTRICNSFLLFFKLNNIKTMQTVFPYPQHSFEKK